MTLSEKNTKYKLRQTAFMIFLTAFAFLSLLCSFTPSFEVYFRVFPSENMGQTLPIAQLRKTPIESLWYLHKQPPVLDILRAITAQFFRHTKDEDLSKAVDNILSYVWTAFFAFMAAFIFIWMNRLCGYKYAVISSFIWILHPAPIFYSRFLDGTLLSSLGILWFFYELYRIKDSDGSIVRLTLSSVFLFYTRTVFQWYFFPLLFTSLVLMKVSMRHICIFIILIFMLVLPYIFKQYILFGTTSTTTFSGYHKCGIIWYRPSESEIESLRSSIPFNYPPPATIFTGSDKENTQKQYEDNLIYTQVFDREIKVNTLASLKKILRSFKMNSNDYWRPSSRYGRGIIINHLFWSKLYNFVFSNYIYASLILFSLSIWLYHNISENNLPSQITQSIGVGLPILYIFIITNLCNRYEWTEAIRLKFLLEPTFYVFIASQICILFQLKTNKKNDIKSKSNIQL